MVAWAVARGFGLWDWSVLPIVADAVQEALGDEAREQLLSHGRWLDRVVVTRRTERSHPGYNLCSTPPRERYTRFLSDTFGFWKEKNRRRLRTKEPEAPTSDDQPVPVADRGLRTS